MLEGSRTKIARAVRAGPAGPASSRAYVSLVTFFAPKKVTNHDASPLSPDKGGKSLRQRSHKSSQRTLENTYRSDPKK